MVITKQLNARLFFICSDSYLMYLRLSHSSLQCRVVRTNVVCLYFVLKGNKGAVGVSFMFNGTSFGFVNCHLTSGNEKITRYFSTNQYKIHNQCICFFLAVIYFCSLSRTSTFTGL